MFTNKFDITNDNYPVAYKEVKRVFKFYFKKNLYFHMGTNKQVCPI